MKYPQLVSRLTKLCEGWIIGSAANPDISNPRDYDIFIPIEKWSLACAIIPIDSKINRMGGFKAISEGIEIDIWTGNMNEMIATARFTYAFHPESGVRIKRI